MKLYVASSWRSLRQPLIVSYLRELGHEVYDFRNPESAFHWSQLDPDWQDWTPEQFREALDHRLAVLGFHSDFEALRDTEATVLVLPCGRSAHLEAGWTVGAGKPLAILLADDVEPELMYRMVKHTGGVICAGLDDLDQLNRWLTSLQRKVVSSG